MSAAAIDADVECVEALDTARYLIQHGVPVFRARPATVDGEWDPTGGHQGTGYWFPPGWEQTKPDPAVVDRWRPGDALCALMGHTVDGLDIDPRNGGDPTKAGLLQAEMWPRSYGTAATPSGGAHELVAPLGVHSKDDTADGLDVKAGVNGDGHGFLFIAPTRKKSKTTGEIEQYRWVIRPDLDGLAEGDDSGQAIADIVRAKRNGHKKNGDEDTEGPRDWLVADRIPAGKRRSSLLSYAGWLRDKNVRHREAVAMMRKRWETCDQPPSDPMPWVDAENLLDDIYRRYEPSPEPTVLDDDHAAEATSSWSPVDLTPYLEGKITRPQPTVGLARSDGLRLLYPGKEHTVIGEMESGKSWFACGCCAAELTNGNRVLYVHFEEADPGDTIERLQALGVPKQTIAALFAFVGPDQPATRGNLAGLLAEPRPSLVVLDGVNEAMSLHGLKVREEDGAAAFRRGLVKPFTAVGAATLAADHVVKDREKRGRDALGSVHKGNGLTGALILLENAEPFGRDLRGRSHLFTTKDRPGHLRRNGRPSGIPGKTFVGELVVDDTRARFGYLDLTFWAPADQSGSSQTGDQTDADDAAVLQAVADLTATGKQASTRTIRATVKGMSNERIDLALTRLSLDGRLIETDGPRNARIFTVPEDPFP